MNENSRLIEKLYAAFAKGDIATVTAHVAPDCEWRGPAVAEIAYSGSYRGPDGAAKFFDKMGTSIEVTAWTPLSYVAEGEDVMTTGTWGCKVRATGKSFTAMWAMHFKVRGGKVIYFQPYEDTAAQVAALRN